MDKYHTFVDRIQGIVAKHPEKNAVTFLQDGETESSCLSYQKLQERAKAIATVLQSYHATGERALLLYQPGIEFVTAFLGCLYAGVVAVPAYPPRANRSIERLLSVVSDADAKFALTTTDLAEKIAHKFEEEGNTSLQFIATDTTKTNLAADWYRPDINSETLAFLQYTSGSTGKPKGVMVCHRNLLANSASINRCFEIVPEHSIVSWLPPYHDMGLIGSILQPIYVGSSLYMMPPVSFLQRPHRWLEVISRYGGTVSGGPNFAYDLCTTQVSEEQKANLDLSSWQVAFSGAEPVRADTIRKFTEYFASCGFRESAFYPCYGMAESTLLITGGSKQVQPIFKDFERAKLAEDKAVTDNLEDAVTLVSSGNNVSGQNLAIVNPDNLEQCAEGNIGEVWAASNSVAQGYWNKTELSEYAFDAILPNYPDVKFLRTGDLGFIKDGELFVTGRLKDLIIIRGRNYYPQDIEFTVDRAHEAIHAGCGAAFAIDIDGQEKLVITYEVKRTHIRKLDTATVTKTIRTAILQNHELNPHTIVLLKTASVPKTSSGKIQRHACKAGFIAGTLKVVGESINQPTSRSERHFAPTKKNHQTSAVENWLINNIAQRLDVNTREINTEEPFASIGLDSVQAVRLSAELEDYLDIKLSPTVIYDYPNISSLAAYLTKSTKSYEPRATSQELLATNNQPIAIIGMDCRFPGANNPEEFWKLLSEGKDAISKCDRWSGSDYGGFIQDVDKFDPQFFGITPRETQRMDPQQRLLLEISWSALENAAIAPESLANSATGVFIGISSSDYTQLQNHYGTELDAYAGTGNAHSIAANRLSYTLDLRGPSISVDTACSSSLVAVHLAINSLRNGECQTAIAGGVNLILSPELTHTFSKAGMMASDGRCKTFDADADGYVRGEGCGVIILKPLDAALRDGDNVLAVVKGSAINQDGRSNGLTAPNSLAQQEVIRNAIVNAGVTPQDISYIEAHGTGTKLGDPIEVNSLKAVLNGDDTCYLSSVKTNIGHLEAAAGIAGLIKTVLCLQKEIIPPHLNFNSLNPHIDFKNTPFTIPTELKGWQQGDKLRLAGISSFGFGGTNAHVVVGDVANVETFHETSLQQNNRPLHLLTLSAKNEPALQDLVIQYQNYLETHSDIAILDICLTANVGRNHFSHRLAITAESTQQLQEKINSYLLRNKTSGIVSSVVERGNKSKIAWLFTGQGSQYEGMGKQLYETQPVFREALEHCAEILQPQLKTNLIDVIYPEEKTKNNLLNQTQYTQAAIFALEYALAQMWLSWGIKPDVVMGHSVGEYVAATIAGVLTLEDGLKLIAERGKLMQALPQNGSMFAVFTNENTVQETIAAYQEEVSIAAVNGDNNIVISGVNRAIVEIISKFESQGISSKQLTVSHAFHSPLMQPILEDFKQVAQTIKYNVPQITLVSNVTGQGIGREIATAEYWVNHVVAPVQFIQGVKELQKQECNIFLEIGAKPILLGMGRNVLESPLVKGGWGGSSCLPSLRLRKSDWSQIIKSVASLYIQGIKINWKNFELVYNSKKIQLPTYPFQRQSYWLEKNQKLNTVNGLANKLTFKQDYGLDYYQVKWHLSEQNLSNLKPKFSTGKWLIFADNSKLGEQIAEQLLQGDRDYLLIHSSSNQKTTKNNLQINYQQTADYTKIIDRETDIQGIIYLGSLNSNAASELSTLDIEQYQEKNYTTILNLIQTLYQKSVIAPIHIVTRGAQQTTQDKLTANSILGNAFWGLGKVIASEHPEYYGGIIDLDRQPIAQEAHNIIKVIGNLEKEDYLALRQDKIYLPRLSKTTATQKQPLTIDADSYYLITGGLGSLGLQVAQWLVSKGAKNLVLVGRSQPKPTAQQEINRLEQQGVTVKTVQADISNYDDVEKVVSNIPLKGIIHSAGVLEDGLLQNQTWSKFQKVLAPKVNGAWNLHLCTQNLDLDFFVLFSSVASLVGSPGQSNYAVANASLDAIAKYRNSLDLPALSINWGAWDNGGMAKEKGFNRSGIDLIQPQQGLSALEELLTGDTAQIGVISVDWDKLSKSYPYIRQSNYFAELVTTVETTANKTDIYGELLALTSDAREEYLVRYLKNAIAGILQIAPQDLSVSKSLLDMGMDSLMLMEAINLIKEDLQLMLYPREFYERPKIDGLAAYLATEFTNTHDCPVIIDRPQSTPVDAFHVTPLPKTSRRQTDHNQSQIDNPIAFILSSPRSGSTLLRVMLAGHPDLVSPPELHLLPFATMQDRQQELDTSYLGEGLQRALMELKGIDAAEAQKLIADLVASNASTTEVYQMLQQLAGDRLLIDKSPTYASDLDNLYAVEATFSNAKYIHLVRHPYAVIESFARMRMDKLLGASNSNPYQLAESIWTESNQNVLDFAQTIHTNRVLLIHYEELVAQPETVMQRVCEFLEIPFRAEVLNPYQGNRMTDGVSSTSMSIGDPNFLNRKQIDPQLANAWRNITLPTPLDYPTRNTAILLDYELPKEDELISEIEHKMEEILVNIRGLRVCLCTWGPKEGPVILCVHGILEQGAAWSEVALRLAQRGYRVIAPDLRGHGKSDRVGKGGSYNLIDFLGDIDAIVEVLAGRAFTLVGHSLGSVVAAIFASVRPQSVKNLVLIETILPTEAREEDAVQQLATHLDYLASPPEHPVFPDVEAAAERLRQTTPALSKSIAMMLAERITEPCEGGVRWRWEPLLRTRAGIGFNGIGRSRYLGLLKRIQAPITLVYGDRSNFNRNEDLTEQQSAMPDAEKVVLSGGHNLPLEAPSGLARIISSAVALTTKLIP
ncbi:Polyketide synthase family protein [Hyella patelloides LEGE 07179]|uniref:Polyketide synthase family protein n=1 Tax=Hyella patelloides LEGE 07179 TaxID=945734 RepID=A0A563VNU0_9CYAN|nr:hybrid fatty acyl-AMP ligase/type I polyketide synthase [Hyella patelloides]VEP13142.1 Polyketide synthase family protein [Hyella patelloides LEGE 07179]